jgi:hypothetical protein
MLKLSGICVMAITIVALGCGDRGSSGPGPDELSKLSPEVFSHSDAATAEDGKCVDTDGILISATGIGPIQLGRQLKTIRARCAIALVKVPASVAIKGPVFGVSVSGGLILFTVSGSDSTVATAGTSSPAFRTRQGIGVGSVMRELQSRNRTLCYKRDSTRIIEVFISRRPLRC